VSEHCDLNGPLYFQYLLYLSFLLHLNYKVFFSKNLQNCIVYCCLHGGIFSKYLMLFKKNQKQAPVCLCSKAIFQLCKPLSCHAYSSLFYLTACACETEGVDEPDQMKWLFTRCTGRSSHMSWSARLGNPCMMMSF
jgi:hypothetical protein